MLWRTGLLNYISPLHSLQVDLDQPKPHTKDVFGHTLAVLHQVQQQKDLVLSLAALYHDIGKPFTRVFTETGLHYYDHEDVGERLVREELARLRFSNSVVDAVATLVKNHMMTLNCGKPALRRLYKRLDGEDLGWRLRDLMKADIQGCSMENWLEYQPAFEAFSMKMVGVWSDEFIVKPEKLKLAINGDMVMEICKIPPGPEVGRILKCLEEAVLDHPRYNNQQWLMNRAERLHVEAK
jgi:putative nucleotidyltransferase with HDIG domain